MNTPKIVCVMLTTGSAVANVGETIHSFNKQLYQNKELIILDTHPQEMKFSASPGSQVSYYPVPPSKFNSHEERFKYALFLATVRNADYVAFWSAGDIFFPWHISDLIARIQDQRKSRPTSPFPFRVGHLNGFLMKDPAGAFPGPSTPDKVYLTHGSEAPQLSGYIFEHWIGHAAHVEAPGGPPQVAYAKLPWHTVLIGTPKVPGYIEVWNTEKAFLAGAFEGLGNGKGSQESVWRSAESAFITASFPSPAVVTPDYWRSDYEALALARWKELFNGKNVDIPAGTVSLWPEVWRLGSDRGCCGGSCGRLARDLDGGNVHPVREYISN